VEPDAVGEPEAAAAVSDLELLAAEIAELTEKAAKADEYLALAQRTQADFENYRKRAIREAKAAQERGALKLVQSLLPAIDNLERALAHMESARDAPSNGTAVLVAGVKHVHTDVIAALGRVGVEPFDPVGEPFDPQYHEAVAQQPVEGTQPGTVVEVFQRGYRSGENVVRPARVVVAG
jgi:molecular chaperone GrpE